MNLHLICVVLMIFSFTETHANVIPVKKLDITKYLGLWYEMYYNQFAASVQGSDIYCTTARFTDNGNGTVALLFLQRLGNETGPEEDFPGTAVQVETSGKFNIFFDRVPFPVPYWVISLGPEKDGLYEYSVATDPRKLGLYVLARNVETFRLDYEEEVLEFVKEQGFTEPSNKPIAIPQNDKCRYPY